jgi:hypothetical protein
VRGHLFGGQLAGLARRSTRPADLEQHPVCRVAGATCRSGLKTGLATGALLWIRRRTGSGILRGLGLALPVLFVSVACVMFERDENMRYKFFVEPVLYVFLVAQGGVVARILHPGNASVGAATTETCS